MANITRQITLTESGADSGPLYDIYYSTDCINYTIAIDGNDVSLPSVGSTYVVTIPDNTTCIKLVNINSLCTNNVIENLGPTTTTTTAAPTTTLAPTTTTTLGPTTTTIAPTSTTTSAPVFYNYTQCNGTVGTLPIRVTTGTLGIGSVVKFGSAPGICATLTSLFVGTPIIFFNTTDNTNYGDCNTCLGITTTTTLSTS